MVNLIDMVEWAANAVDAILAIVFLTIMLGKKEHLPKGIYVLFAIICTFGNVWLQLKFPDSPENNCIYILITICFGLICTNGKLSQKILHITIWNILLMFCGILYATIYGYVRGPFGVEWEMTARERFHYLLGSKLNLLLLFIVVLFFLRKIKMKTAMPVMNFVVFIISMIIGIILDIMLEYQYLDRKGKLLIGIAMIGIMVINIFVYVASYRLNRNQKLLMENQLLKLSQEEQKESMERMMQLQETNRIFRHDLRHYFTVFRDFLDSGDIEEAKKYVGEIIDTKLQTEGVYCTGDKILDAVLNHCDNCCHQKGITFYANICAHLPKEQMAFAIALLNLLENAIEAEEQEKEKYIELQIYESAGVLLVSVKNRISSSVLLQNPELKTKKDDAAAHGFGRKSVRNMIQDMDGTFFEEEKNGFFISNIVVKY